MAQLDVHSLTVGYVMKRNRRALTAVQDLGFTVRAGEFVAIVGPSGCGKTTVLNAIAGLIPWQAGQITIDGRPVNGPGRDRAMVFQSPALLPWRSVLRNVAYGLELQGMARRKAEGLARDCLALVGLAEFAESYPAELSGGMQQRANLARALAVQPQVLLFDEPLAALDAQTREKLQLELQRIWQQSHVTALFVTHQIDEAILLADRVLVMSASPGQIKANMPIPLPRPRTHQCRYTLAFAQLETAIRNALDDPQGESVSVDRGVAANGS